MSNRFAPSAEELRLLTEHLYYEVWMTFDLAMLLAVGKVPRRQPMHNAMVETFPMHVRQLVDFFWKERSSSSRRADKDAFAADYFDRAEWAALRPERPTELHAAWLKTGWGVVHLTYRRANATLEDKLWRQITICEALAPVACCFIDNVDPAKLDSEWFGEMRRCMDRFSAFTRWRAGRQARTATTTATSL